MVPDFLTISEAAKLIQQRELSPVELVESRLARIEKLDSRLHSFIRVLADSARAEARAAESEIAAGKYRGPLHGIPPTYGIVSRMGILPLAFSLDHAGPMAWTAEDCAIMLQAMAGHDPTDPGSASRPIPDYRAALKGDVKGLRIGLVRHFHERDNEANAATRNAIDTAAKQLAELGCSVRDVALS